MPLKMASPVLKTSAYSYGHLTLASHTRHIVRLGKLK